MEKRTTDRHKKRMPVRFGVKSTESFGFTGDISGTGIFIKSSKIYPPGSDLKMEITLPDDRVIKMTGRVVWAKRVPPNLIRFIAKSGMGVFLHEVPDEYYIILRNLEE